MHLSMHRQRAFSFVMAKDCISTREASSSKAIIQVGRHSRCLLCSCCVCSSIVLGDRVTKIILSRTFAHYIFGGQ